MFVRDTHAAAHDERSVSCVDHRAANTMSVFRRRSDPLRLFGPYLAVTGGSRRLHPCESSKLSLLSLLSSNTDVLFTSFLLL